MNQLLRTAKPGRFFLIILVFLIATDLAILLDIPILRQFLGFLFFTIIPGLLLVYILKLDKLGLTEKIVLSVGLSVSFLMFFGLIVNSTSLALGHTKPLTTTPLVISFSAILLILLIVAHLTNRTAFSFNLADFHLDAKEKTFLLLPTFFPLLSILGMHLMNSSDNNVMLMALLLLIPAYIILVVILHHQVPERTLPVIIFLFGISLLLLFSLRSSHIIGSDTHAEYYLFQLTSDSGQWRIFTGGVLDACLSISLLPAIYQSFLNINSEYLFKILYSLLFSISPLVVYLISKKYIGSFYAFLASFLFMAQSGFLSTPALSRSNIAVLFFALAIMVIFHDGISEVSKRALFIIFAASTLISHYSTSYIFFFLLLLIWAGMQIIPKIITPRRNSASQPLPQSQTSPELPQPRLKSHITIGVVILFFIMLFLWYSQLTGEAFGAGVRFVSATLEKLNQFFILESRGTAVEAGFGVGLETAETRYKIEFVINWLIVIFIAIGVLTTLVRHRQTVASPNRAKAPPDFITKKFDAEFLALSLASAAIMMISVVLPHIGSSYYLGRTYFQMMIILAPFFIIGGIMLTRFLRAYRANLIVLLTVLILYFIGMTGTMDQMLGSHTVMTLNSQGAQYERFYVHDQENYAAKWIRENAEEGAAIYSHHPLGRSVLMSQGKIPPSQTKGSFISQYQEGKDINGYIYLRYVNITAEGIVIEYPDIFAGKSKIYATNGSEVYESR